MHQARDVQDRNMGAGQLRDPVRRVVVRAEIEDAVALVRKNRQVMLGLPRVRQPLPDIRPERPA